jgi:hypothetical protein
MTESEIRMLQPGDSIIGAFGEWEDELPIAEVLRFTDGTRVRVQSNRTRSELLRLEPNGPEILGVKQ